MNRAQILNLLATHQGELCRDFGVQHIGIFGSASRDELRDSSDVDVLVEFRSEAHAGLFQFVRLQRRLEEILQRRVDLATPDSLKRQLKEGILEEVIRAA